MWVFLDGRMVKGADASVSVWDHGLLYGDGIYEGIRVYGGRIFKLEAHLARLFDSARAIQLAMPLTPEQFAGAIIATLRANNLKDAHIRPVVTRGPGKPGLDPRRTIRSSVMILASAAPPTFGDKPVRLLTAAIRRKAPLSIDGRIKSLNYLDNIMAKLQSNAFGADDALMLDPSGFVVEATASNIFLVKNGKLMTPALTAALPGITRQVVMELSVKRFGAVFEQSVSLSDLYTADEVFIAGTASEIVAVGEIDGRIIADGKTGLITADLQKDYKELVRTSGNLVFDS
ncbi:MAG: branched-chain-amino-acid transaminase [Chloroflexi bacterium GWB2_49_20]|nr:MAG: branched-chain-amino-acid transaminase [Chloroflexi bacterium GWB2_49_20]OGN76880.1 MAG: branched-chain-amino-acid transaminase [Chloroflexi bacterium GWC2_49_37]OGN84400.1 MAG: branched-chain-amino-acid transaminase [Chloroflexi bacterium GWD2_49_16]